MIPKKFFDIFNPNSPSKRKKWKSDKNLIEQNKKWNENKIVDKTSSDNFIIKNEKRTTNRNYRIHVQNQEQNNQSKKEN